VTKKPLKCCLSLSNCRVKYWYFDHIWFRNV